MTSNGNGVSKTWLLGVVVAALLGLLAYGGASLADRVSRVEENQTIARERIAAMMADLNYIRATVDLIYRKVTP